MYRYELRLHYDYHDDMEFRQTRKEVSSSICNHRRASSHPQISHGSLISITTSPTENAIKRVHKRKSQRLLDVWSLKSTCIDVVDGTRLIEVEAGKGEEGEIVAMAFSLPEDMERGNYSISRVCRVKMLMLGQFMLPMANYRKWKLVLSSTFPSLNSRHGLI